MPHTVTIADTGEHYACTGDESLLSAMARLGRRGFRWGAGAEAAGVQGGSPVRRLSHPGHEPGPRQR
jgi:hypothetical protein